MLRTRLSIARRLGKKAISVAPLVAANPRLLSLLKNGVHPEHFTRLNVKWLGDANIQTVLDIGANTGQFTGAIHALFPDATIYAFEPLAESFRVLAERHADHPNVVPFRTAVGDEDGEITFHRNAFSQSSSALELTMLHRDAFPWAVERSEIQVPVRRLDSMLDELTLTPTVLVKIDVQGYEDRVLRGARRLMEKVDYVLVETSFEPLYKNEATFAAVYDLLSGAGFRFAGSIDQIVNPANDRPLYADALFVRSSR